MSTVRPQVSEEQLLDCLRQLPSDAKQRALAALIPDLADLDDLVAYGEERASALCADRGIDWQALDDDGRQAVIDELLHGG